MNGTKHAAPPPPPPPPSSDISIPPPPLDGSIPPPPSDHVPPPPASSVSRPPPPPTHAVAQKKSHTPLKIEDLLKKKREADAAKAKPRFLSKAERERIALEKRQAEVDSQKRRQDAEKAAVVGSIPNGSRQNGSNGTHVSSDRSAATARLSKAGQVPTEPASMRNGRQGTQRVEQSPQAESNGTAKKDDRGTKRQNWEEEESSMVRNRYMGPDMSNSKFSAQKKRKRTTDKKFNFDWSAEDDTTQNHTPLYQGVVQANFFGRGKLGGYDDTMTDENARAYAKALEERDPEYGRQRAQQFLEMQRRAKESKSRMSMIHWSQKQLEDMRERDWRIFKEDFNISTKGGSIPNPMRSWDESGLPRKILDIVADVGYTEPSAVQRAAIPIALGSRDIIGVAVTGSGKTAAFLLPLLVYISDLPTINEFTKNDGPYAIILAPTRELAQQIEIEAKKFATPLGFTCVSIVGGHSIEEQAYQMRDGAEIIIATPGRLVDCIERRLIVLSQCCYIIMDEADRMIDLGFEEPVNKILDALPVGNEKPDNDDAEDAVAMSRHLGGKDRYRQTMMYTATMPTAVERIARKYLRRPATVTIGNAGEAVETVEQRVEFVSGEDRKKKRLAEILRSNQFAPPIIVFVNIKRNCDAVARDIRQMGFSAVTLHGSKTQEQREAALASLRNGSSEVLVATDLAGRGIDVADVSLVVNFNMATSIESYTHRIGRTGRAGKSGVAITFLGNEDTDVMYDLKQILSKSSISKVPEELRKHEAAQQKQVKGRKGEESKGGFGRDITT